MISRYLCFSSSGSLAMLLAMRLASSRSATWRFEQARLDALGFIWDRHEALWEEGFDHLQAFVKENKHCEVSDAHVAEDGYPLGQWVRVQRRERDRISAERRPALMRLDSSGMC